MVREGLTAGHLHEGKIKVNPHRRQEAYVSLEGVPHDVKIDGYDAQNRVIDGDTVVFAIDPMNDWPALEDKTPRRKRRGAAAEAAGRRPSHPRSTPRLGRAAGSARTTRRVGRATPTGRRWTRRMTTATTTSTSRTRRTTTASSPG